MPSCDAILIGGGTNGLACATRLAQKGLKVTLLEGQTLGGGLHLSDTMRAMDPRVMDGMALAQHGLSFHAPLQTTLLGGPQLSVQRGKTTGPDTQAFAQLHAKLTDFARVLAPFRQMTAPRLTTQNDWPHLARLGLGIRALGKQDFREFLRMILINIADVAEDELTDDRLKGLLAFDATLGAWAGPRSPNTLILLLNHLAMGADIQVPKGGMGQVATAMQSAALKAGVTILHTKATQILIENDRAVGVQADQTYRAPIIISAINPRTTFQSLIGPRHLDAGFHNRTNHIRSRGATAKLRVTLNQAPDLDQHHRYVIAPSVNAVELAFNPVKYGEVPLHPVMEFTFPSAFTDASQTTLSANVQFAPHNPKNGLENARAEMLQNTLNVLHNHIDLDIAQATLLMPQDIESQYGMIGGNWHHGELAVEQMLFLRPLPEAAQYATPIPGLFLASAGSHPGGGINGTAGWNAAGEVIKTL